MGRIRDWANVIDRPAPAPADLSSGGKAQLSPKFTEWLMGLQEGWVTGNGLTRSQELQALGNGVVPQQAAVALHEMYQNIQKIY